jgi:hypothetical protein
VRQRVGLKVESGRDTPGRGCQLGPSGQSQRRERRRASGGNGTTGHAGSRRRWAAADRRRVASQAGAGCDLLLLLGLEIDDGLK